MIIHTQAIVLRSVDYQESSKIVTLFTWEHGKIAVIVRGAKKPKSKFAGLMEPGNMLDVVYYYKTSRSVQTLSEAGYSETAWNLKRDFEKMATAMSALELIQQLLHDHEINHPLFKLTRRFLLWLNDMDRTPAKIFPYLQIRLGNVMGLGLQVEEPEQDVPMYFNLETGQISETSRGGHSYKLSSRQYQYMNLSLKTRSSALLDINFENGELKELVYYLDRYLKYHVEGLKDRTSDAIFEQLLVDG